MPRVLPANLVNYISPMGAREHVKLLDVQLRDGSLYYFSDFNGNFPMKLGAGGNVQYKPWIKKAGPFRVTRTTSTDAGTVTFQNISGNTIDRDFAKLLNNGEFEGALVVYREWNLLLAVTEWEFHGSVSEPGSDMIEGSFRLLQLCDPNGYDVPLDTYSDKCTLRYKGPLCGSVSGLATCDKLFASCVTRGATERFNGIPNPTPQDLMIGGGTVGGSFAGGGGGRNNDGEGPRDAKLEVV
jgi:hypothetical protein